MKRFNFNFKHLFVLLAVLLLGSTQVWGTEYSLFTGTTIDNTNFITGGIVNTDGTKKITVDKVDITNYFLLQSTCTTVVAVSNPQKVIIYNCKTTATRIDIVAYDKSSTSYNLYVTNIEEGQTGDLSVQATNSITGKSKETYTYNYVNTKGRSIYIHANSTSNVCILSVTATETGTPLPIAGEPGYKLNLNKGRLVALKSVDNSWLGEGLEFQTGSSYACYNKEYLACGTSGTTYVKFTTGVRPVVLSVTTNRNKPYSVNKVKAFNNDSSWTPTASTPHEFNLEASTTYYINPNGSDIYLTNLEFICVAPTGLAASSLTSSGATLTVTDAANNDKYEFYISESSTAPTAGSTATHSVTDSKTIVIDDLDESTTYYAWVRSCNKNSANGKSSWTALTGNTFTTEAAAPSCTAPTSVSISSPLGSTGWAYIKGETIQMHANVSGGSGTPHYTWQKKIDSEFEDIDGAPDDDDYEIANCTASNSGTYRCIVSTGDGCSTTSSEFDVKVYRVQILLSAATTDYDFTTIDRTEGYVQCDILLQENTDYAFKILEGHVGLGNNSATGLTSSDHDNWGMWESNANHVGLRTTFTDNYRFTWKFASASNNNTVSVTYPTHNQTADKTIYFDNSKTNWSNIYYRIGNAGHNENSGMVSKNDVTKVAGTANFYQLTTWAYNNFLAWHFADNTSWSGDKNSIYKTDGTGYVINNHTAWQKYVVSSTITLSPTTNDGGTPKVWSVDKTTGMKTYTVTSSATNCTITLEKCTNYGSGTYTALSSGGTVMPTQYVKVTVTPSTGHEWNSFSVSGTEGTDYDVVTAAAAGTPGVYIIMGDVTFTASCSVSTYDITYHDGKGMDFSGSHATGHPTTHTYGTATDLKIATKSGYVFGGWYDNNSFTGDPVTSLGATTYTGDIDLYAKWEKDVYLNLNGKWSTDGMYFAVYYWKDGGSGNGWVSMELADACSDPKVYKATIPSNYYDRIIFVHKNSNTLETWDNKEHQTGDLTFPSSYDQYTLSKDDGTGSWIEDYSIPTFTISYNKGTNGTGTKDNESKTCNVDFTLPSSAVFTRTGYTQTGWTTSDGGTQTHELGGNYTTDAAQTFYPVWTAKEYEITLDRNDASSGSEAVTMTYNSSSHTSITAPTKAGYTFEGWYDSESNNNGTGNLVIDVNGVLQANVTSYTGADGIWTKESGTTLYAKWEENCYSFTPSGDNETIAVGNTVSGSTGGTMKVATAKIVKTAENRLRFDHDGDAQGSVLVTLNNYMQAGTIISLSIHNPDAKKNRGLILTDMNSTTESTCTHGTAGVKHYLYTVVAGDGLEGEYRFVLKRSQSAELVALSVAYCGADRYTVTYKANGGTGDDIVNPTATTVASNTFTAPTGYHFNGWNTADDGEGASYSEGATVDDNLTLYAQWEANKYDINYYDGGATDNIAFSGSHADGYPTKHTYGSSTTLKSATKTGYTFGGWFDNYSCEDDAVTSIGATAITANTKLYAKWTINSHTLTWNFDGGSTSDESYTAGGDLDYGTAITYPGNATMSKTGYIFNSWSTSATTMPDEDLAITASWTRDVKTAGWGAPWGATAIPSNTTSTVNGVTLNATGITTGTLWGETSYNMGNGKSITINLPDGYYISAVSTSALFDSYGGNTNKLYIQFNSESTYDDSSYDLDDPIQLAGNCYDEWDNLGDATPVSVGSVPSGAQSAKIYCEGNSDSGDYLYRIIVEITAWDCTPSTVTFAAGGGTGAVPLEREICGDITLPGPGSLKKKGNTFAGWNDGEDDYEEGDTYTVAGDVTLTALWTPFTVPTATGLAVDEDFAITWNVPGKLNLSTASLSNSDPDYFIVYQEPAESKSYNSSTEELTVTYTVKKEHQPGVAIPFTLANLESITYDYKGLRVFPAVVKSDGSTLYWDYDNIPTSDSWTRVTQTPTTIYPNAGIQNPLPAAKAITFSGNPLADKTNESFYIRNVFYHCTGMIDVDHVVLMRKEGSAATDTTEAGTATRLYSGKLSHYTDETIEPGKTYYYTIFSVHADGTLSAGTTQSATVPKDDLDVTATAGTASSITQTSATLSFTLSSTTGVASVTLKVYDSEDELVATVAGVTAATSGSGEITGLDAGTTYYFTVTPIGDATHNDGTESTKSSTFTTETCTPYTVSKVTMSAYNSGSKSGYNNDEYAGTPKYSLSSTKGEGSTHTGYKLGSEGHHIYAQLGKGSFEEGDVIKVYVSKPNDAYKVDSKAQTILDLYIHDGSSTHTLLHTIEGVDKEGEYTYTLTASDITTIGAYKYIGVYRPSSGRTQNPYIYSVEIEGCRSWTPSHDVSTVVSGSVGGTVSAAASSVMEGGTTTITATPETGYEVTNWAVSGTGASIDPSGASNETEATLTMGTADATVTVTFGLADYSVTYNGNSPTSGSAPTDGNTYNYNDDVTVLGDNSMSKTGYTFRGWTDGTTFYKAGEKFKMPAEDVTLTAVWESNSGSETITLSWFDSSQGSNSSSKPDSEGKWLYGYTNSAKTSGYAYTITTASTNNKSQGTGDSDYMRLNYGTNFNVYADNTGTGGTPTTFSNVTAVSLTVKLKKDAPTMTIKVGSTTIADAVSLSSASTSEFTTFTYDNLADLSGKITITNNGSGSTNYDIYIDDIAITYASPYFDVAFDDMSGFTGSSTLPSTITGVPSGNKIQEPATEPEAAGYDFDGWYTDASCESAVNWNTMTITADKTLYAKWTEAEYSITYKDKGDETFTGGGSLPSTHTYGTITLLEDATKTGYRFDGWYDNAACTGYRKYTLGATSYTDDITLYAKWTLVVDDDNENFEGYDTPSSYNDVLITNGATLTISTDKTVQDITVETGSTLNIAKDGESGITFTVNSLSLVGGWGLVDGKKKYDMPRVFIDQASTLTKTGGSTVNLDVALDNDNYYPIAVPFPVDVSAVDYADPYLAGFSRYGFSGQYAIKKYNGQQRADRGANYANWEIMNDGVDVGYGSGTETLVPGRGYIVTALPVPGEEYAVLRFPMTVDNKWTTEGEQGSITVKVEEEDVTTTKNVVRVEAYVKEKGETPKMHKGWNLLGIPYMSCYQTGSDMYAGGGAAAIMQGKFDFSTNQFDDEDPIRYVSVPTHNFSEYLQYNIVDEETKLLPGWCFFVQVETTGDLTYVAAKETASGLLYAPKREQEHKPTIKTGIILSGNEASDKTTFLISDKYSAAEYEINADLEKMFGENSYTLATYSLSGETRLAYNAMSRADAANVIPIGYRAPAEGEYTFAINPRYAESGDFERIDLIDYETGFVTNLLQSSYTFTSNRTQSDSRFALNVVPQKETPTGLENDANDANGARKVIIDNKLYIILNGKMYDAKGVMVK